MTHVRMRGARSRSIVAAVAAVAVLAGSPPARAAADGSAFLRVDQVGYDLHGPKRAYLMASEPEGGATFSVLDEHGTTVLSGAVGDDLGSWSAAFPYVYAVDFDGVTAPGRYTISVSGPAPANSLSFPVAASRYLYAEPLANTLFFYRAERDGPHYWPSALRTAPAHLNDRSAMTYRTPAVNSDGVFKGSLSPLGRRIDASGGWWDAGDYLKFVMTTSYTVALMLDGVRDFPDEMGAGSPISNFTDEGRFGLDWLMKMWNDRTKTLYYQVGIGEGNAHIVGDHDIWRLPQADDTYGGTNPAYRYIRHRPVFRAGPPGSPVSPNLAGRDAAAMALGYQVFRTEHPRFARRALRSAEDIYDLADTHPGGHLLTVLPRDFYPESTWRDDMEFGATELYFALASGGAPANLPHRNPMYFLRQAAHWAHGYMTGKNDASDTLNLYDVSGLAHFELVRAIRQAGSPAGMQTTVGALIADMKKELDAAVARSSADPFGFGYGWAQWDTTTHGTGMSVEASEYDQLTGTSTYADYSRRWLANVFGANAWGTSLIVGDGTVYPHCMQHQVSNLVGSLDGSAPILAGAAVEGPNSFAARGRVQHMRTCPADGVDQFAQFNGTKAVYQDNVQSYSTVEPAIDLTASGPLAFARQSLGLF